MPVLTCSWCDAKDLNTSCIVQGQLQVKPARACFGGSIKLWPSSCQARNNGYWWSLGCCYLNTWVSTLPGSHSWLKNLLKSPERFAPKRHVIKTPAIAQDIDLRLQSKIGVDRVRAVAWGGKHLVTGDHSWSSIGGSPFLEKRQLRPDNPWAHAL